MNFQILPNWFKKLGLIFFILASIINGGINFFGKSYTVKGIDASNPAMDVGTLGFKGLLNAFTGGGLLASIDVFAILGMIIYILSKEKIEDDYIEKLRLESYQLTTLFILLTAVVLYFSSKELILTLNYFIFPFLWLYISFFFIKKKFSL